MEATKLILVRHGRTLWNSTGRFQGQSDIELSAEGLEQAQTLANNFPVEHIDVVYSSNLSRAFVTGKTIAAKFNVPIIADTRLREISFGLWEGLTYDQIHAKWSKELDMMFNRPDLDFRPPEGESFTEVQNRAIAALQEIIANNQGKTIVVTAHGGILRTILAHALHMPLRYIWSIRQDNTAVNIVTYYSEKATVELINGTAHFGPLQVKRLSIVKN